MRFEDEAPVARPARGWWLITAVLFALLLHRLRWHFDLAPMLAILAAGTYGLVEGSRTPQRPGKKASRVEVDATGLRVDGKLTLARADVTRVAAVARDDGMRAVHLVGRRPWQSVVVFVDSDEKSRALVAALELHDRHATSTRFRAQPPWARRFRVLAVVLGATPWLFANNISWLPRWAVVVLVGLYAMLLAPAVLPLRVDVGSDGILLRWLGKRRFVAFGTIDEVTMTRVGVELSLAGGEKLEIRLSQKDNTADAAIGELAERIQRGVDVQGASAAEVEAYLARGDRDAGSWLRDMRALGSGVSTYRQATITRDRLWMVVETPSADASAREGAALALSVQLDDDERSRLASLASTTVWPRLRVAFEGVSRVHARDDDEARLRVALEDADAEELAHGDAPGHLARRARPR